MGSTLRIVTFREAFPVRMSGTLSIGIHGWELGGTISSPVGGVIC